MKNFLRMQIKKFSCRRMRGEVVKTKQECSNVDDNLVIFLCGNKKRKIKTKNKKKLLEIAREMFQEDFKEKENAK